MFDLSYADFDSEYWYDQQRFRWQQMEALPNFTGTYTLCDHRGRPIYCGATNGCTKKEGTKKRVSRHMINLRSDVASNHRIEICLIASIQLWQCTPDMLKEAEKAMIAHFGHENLLNCGRKKTESKIKFSDLESGPTIQLVTEEYKQTWLLNPERRIILNRLHVEELTRHYVIRKRTDDVAKARDLALRYLQETEEECRRDRC